MFEHIHNFFEVKMTVLSGLILALLPVSSFSEYVKAAGYCLIVAFWIRKIVIQEKQAKKHKK